MKKFFAVLLTVAMLCTLCVAFSADASGINASAAQGTPTVDGVKEAAWDAASEYQLSHIIKGDSLDPTNYASSTVKFRMMWDANWFYMLFEIDDDYFRHDETVSNREWNNDAIFLYISEDGGKTLNYTDNITYQMAIPVKDGVAPSIRSNKRPAMPVSSENTQKATVITGADGAKKAVVEVAFKFVDTTILTSKKFFSLDVQYHDSDPGTEVQNNTRTICWTWSAEVPNDSAFKAQWARVNLNDGTGYKALFDIRSEWYIKTGTTGDAPVAGNWNTSASVYGGWSKANAPFGNILVGSTNAWNTSGVVDGTLAGDQPNAWLWAVKEFTVKDASDYEGWSLVGCLKYDETPLIYINGVQVFFDKDAHTYNDRYDYYEYVWNASKVLVDGTNVIAVSLHQMTGNYEFDTSLYLTQGTVNGLAPKYARVDTADEFIAYTNIINTDGVTANMTKGSTLEIGADIDMAGKTYEPIDEFIGLIEGNGHTISNMSYTATTGSDKALIVRKLGNQDGASGTVQNLTVKDSVLNAPDIVDGKAAAIVGYSDRGIISNCKAENVTITGGNFAGGIIGLARYGSAGSDNVIVKDCTVKNCTINAALYTGAIAAACSNCPLELGNAVVDNVTLNSANAPSNSFVGKCDSSIVLGSSAEVHSTLAADTTAKYSFYYQTRTGAEGTVDYRIIVVADEAWIKTLSDAQLAVTITITDGEAPKSTTATPVKAYLSIDAAGDGYTDMYTASAGNVIYGWVVTGVAATYNAVSASFGA